MSRFLEKAEKLRNDPDVHYNCAQTVLMTFADEAGLSEEIAWKLMQNYGAGMKMGGTCGAMSAGLMALAAFGVNDGPSISEFWRTWMGRHEKMTDCRDLLRVNAERGGEKKPHCDAMVYESVQLVEQMLVSRGLLEA